MRRTGNAKTDQVARSLEERVARLEAHPLAQSRIIPLDNALADSTWTEIPHGLGRRWRGVSIISAPRQGNVAEFCALWTKRTPKDDTHVTVLVYLTSMTAVEDVSLLVY